MIKKITTIIIQILKLSLLIFLALVLIYYI